jgi:hypothetical protein
MEKSGGCGRNAVAEFSATISFYQKNRSAIANLARPS